MKANQDFLKIDQFNLKENFMFAIKQNHSTPNFKTPNSSFNNSFNDKSNRKSLNSDEKRGVERFRRVKEEEVQIDDRVVDNSFEAKVSVLKYSKWKLFPGELFSRKEKRRKVEFVRKLRWTRFSFKSLKDTHRSILPANNLVALIQSFLVQLIF